MKKKILEALGTGAMALCIIAVLMIIGYGISWIATCGLIYLITLCFGWEFNWLIATGIWLLIIIARSIFSHNTTVHNHNK